MAGEMLWSTQSGYLSNGYLTMQFQKAAQPLMKFRQFCKIKEAFGKKKGETVNWLKVANVETMGGSLVETNTMHESTQALDWGTLTVNEYGNSIPFSFKIDALSMFELRSIINEGLLDDSAKCLDASVEREFNKCALRGVGTATNTLTLTTNGTTTATNTSAMYPYHLRKLILELKKRNVPGYSKLGGDYVSIASIYALDSFQGAMEALTYTMNTETGLSMALNGEVGRFYATRFVEDNFASYNIYSPTARTATSVFANAAAGTGYDSTSWTLTNSGPAYVFGSPTVREAVVVPEEIRQKVVTDYGRSFGLAWYALLGWKIEYLTADGDNARIIKWDSA